jgi:hypothetical protein
MISSMAGTQKDQSDPQYTQIKCLREKIDLPKFILPASLGNQPGICQLRLKGCKGYSFAYLPVIGLARDTPSSFALCVATI